MDTTFTTKHTNFIKINTSPVRVPKCSLTVRYITCSNNKELFDKIKYITCSNSKFWFMLKWMSGANIQKTSLNWLQTTCLQQLIIQQLITASEWW